ncbi:MAG: 1-hydroxycarotenoid 3,4-desaturase CrtD [Myxococcota bacterium]
MSKVLSSPSETLDTIVVGGGVGGLSAALRVAGAGGRVVVLERATEVGGKMRVVRVGGHEIDAGPTVLTMRHVFERLWGEAGLDFHAAVPTRPLEVLARHAWPGGATLDLFADEERSADAIAAFAGKREAAAFRRFHKHAAKIYETVKGPFIEAETPGIMAGLSRTGPGGLWQLMRIDWHRSLWRTRGSFFRDPRLRQLFARYATYYGSNPFSAPGTLSLIANVEQAGVWRVDGGMIRLARATARAIESLGGEVRCGTDVVELLTDGDGVCGVRCSDGTTLRAKNVIFNGSPAALQRGLLGKPATAAMPARSPEPSLSAVTFCGVGKAERFDLQWHNVFFSEDYEAEFDAIFKHGRVPVSPTTYICAQDRGSLHEASERERLFCLINAPARGGDDDFVAEIDSCKNRMTQVLSRCGLTLTMDPASTVVTTPNEFASMFPQTKGALYGPATHGATSAFARPGASTKIPGLYLVGGEAHPGAGLPMVTLGGRIAADRVLDRLGLTRTSPTAGTRGGMSMPSAKTASWR